MNIESVSGHIAIDLIARIPLPERDSISMCLEDLLYNLLKSDNFLLSLSLQLIMLKDVIT
jgi:hypothetical protein